GCFEHIEQRVQPFTYTPGMPFFSILVPTTESTSQFITLDALTRNGTNVLFSGETGVGKSVGITAFLDNLVREGEQADAAMKFTVATANFSAQTSSGNVVDIFETRLDRKRKNLLGPPAGSKMIVFVDDINMPLVEVYGAQPPIELLRQVVDYKGFYDRRKLFWKNVADTQIIAACGPPGGGRNAVTPRLLRHFCMQWIPDISKDAMILIFDSILNGWLMAQAPHLAEMSNAIVRATVDAFFDISRDLLPTPLKSHYTFNLRDPAKMLQGMLMVDGEKVLTGKDELLELWLHEATRQFRDRLIDDVDREWFDELFNKKLSEFCGVSWEIPRWRELMFGDYMDRAANAYTECHDPEKLSRAFQEYLDEYNMTYPSTMNLIFFSDARAHLSRVARVIRQPRGNALLVGVSGVGRKSVTRMAAFMAEYSLVTIEITRSYDSVAFKEDIKSMMLNVAKSSGKGLVFLFSDTQIVKESFLECINNILNTGEVPNLFAADEVEQIIGLVRPLAKAAGKQDSRDVIWSHFVHLVRESLHIVLAFSPVGEAFRARCRQFPSLINCCTIDWFMPWPKDALYSVAERNYKDADKSLGIDNYVGSLSTMSGVIHSSVTSMAENFFSTLRRRTYITPTSYLELIKLFLSLLEELQGVLTARLKRYTVGVDKLNQTNAIVDKLKQDLTEMQPVLKKASEDTATLMEQVTRDEADAQEKKLACAEDEKAASAAAAEANAIKTDCQADLDEAMPAYHSAMKSLESLDKKDIQEAKSFTKPPALVEVVLKAVCLLLGKKETWDDAKKVMGDMGFLQSLKSYDKDSLASNQKLTAKLQTYISRDDFNAESVSRVSKAATSLCMWVIAMDVYG
ncbi:hypothetical protein FOZ62_026768, partial [Perkinsus olseni]